MKDPNSVTPKFTWYTKETNISKHFEKNVFESASFLKSNYCFILVQRIRRRNTASLKPSVRDVGRTRSSSSNTLYTVECIRDVVWRAKMPNWSKRWAKILNTSDVSLMFSLSWIAGVLWRINVTSGYRTVNWPILSHATKDYKCSWRLNTAALTVSSLIYDEDKNQALGSCKPSGVLSILTNT